MSHSPDDSRGGPPPIIPPYIRHLQCQRCQKPLRARSSAFGSFFGCPEYPICTLLVPVDDLLQLVQVIEDTVLRDGTARNASYDSNRRSLRLFVSEEDEAGVTVTAAMVPGRGARAGV